MDQTPLNTLQDRANGFLTDIVTQHSRIDGTILVTGSYDTTTYSDALFDRLGILLPPQLHRAVARRKADFLAGRAMAKAAMTLLDIPPEPVTIASNRAPVWPTGLVGSISHARGRCACLLSRDTTRSHGVDTEAIARDRSLTAILTETLNDHERATITQGILPPATNATLTFSAKETLFKALYPGVGHHFGFDAAELTSAPDQDTLTLALTTDLTENLTKGRRFDIHHRLSNTHVLTWLAVRVA